MDASEAAKNQVHSFLALMGYTHLDPTEVREREGRVFVSVSINQPQDLIGERGVTLRAFQHVVRLALTKQLGELVRVDVDVNNYKKKRSEFLSEFARKVGEKVRAEKREIELEPMSAFDRRVIHSALAEYTDVTTESRGEEPRRYISVKPLNLEI